MEEAVVLGQFQLTERSLHVFRKKNHISHLEYISWSTRILLTDCTSLILAQSGLVGKGQNKRRTDKGFQIFPTAFSIVNPCKSKQKMPQTCGDMVGNWPGCSYCILLAWSFFVTNFSFSHSLWKHLETRWEMAKGVSIFILASPKTSSLLCKHCRQGLIFIGLFPVPIRHWPEGL